MTLDAAAEALEYSRQKIWCLECGQGSVRVLDVKAMCELYGVSPEMTEALRGLAAETKSRAGGTRTATRCRSGSSCT
ncbi:helix-turn-helix domain-containing protein [Micromonospora sp. NPDC005291]|uniref:helix-turn-helix domain-containing protein n=1 Tax=Micromonospora sp. NPDC005291 TaxID=3156872 RepID=UPI0033B6BE27